METRYDRMKKREEERKMRVANIANIENELNEAKAVFEVIPDGGLVEFRERITVQRHISELKAMLADEQQAYDQTFADENDIPNL